MSIFKSILLASVRIALLGVLKAALLIYILFLPNSPSPADARDGQGFRAAGVINARATGAAQSLPKDCKPITEASQDFADDLATARDHN